MTRVSRGSGDSLPSTVLGADGTIDLSGDAAPRVEKVHSPGQPSGDAWLADHARRSLVPPAKPQAPADRKTVSEAIPGDLAQEIADRFALGDYAGALSMAELQLGLDPNDRSARDYATQSRRRLEARYTTRIGSLEHVFNRAVPAAKVKWLGLDPQAAFLLSLVDGQTRVSEVLALCPMGRLEALRVFTELLDAKAIVRVA